MSAKKFDTKGKGKVPPGCLSDFGARLWHYAAELRTLSVTYPLCGSALTYTMDNPSEMCPLKLTNFCLFLYH